MFKGPEQQPTAHDYWYEGADFGVIAGIGAPILGIGLKGLLQAKAYFAAERRFGLQQKFTPQELANATERLKGVHGLTTQLLGGGHIEVLGQLINNDRLKQDVQILRHHQAEKAAKKSKILVAVGVVLMIPFYYRVIRDFGPEIVDWVNTLAEVNISHQ